MQPPGADLLMAEPPTRVRVLMVDDHPLVRNGLRAIVETALPGVAIEADAWTEIERGRGTGFETSN